MSDSTEPVVRVGLIRPRDHCTFSWEEGERGGTRTARIRSTHCAECVAELGKLGYIVSPESSEDDRT